MVKQKRNIMNFIKVTNTNGNEVLINLLNVSHFFQNNAGETVVCFTTYEDFITIKMSIGDFHKRLDAIANTYVWVF